jgi:hypothetical protein
MLYGNSCRDNCATEMERLQLAEGVGRPIASQPRRHSRGPSGVESSSLDHGSPLGRQEVMIVVDALYLHCSLGIGKRHGAEVKDSNRLRPTSSWSTLSFFLRSFFLSFAGALKPVCRPATKVQRGGEAEKEKARPFACFCSARVRRVYPSSIGDIDNDPLPQAKRSKTNESSHILSYISLAYPEYKTPRNRT